MRRPSRNMSCRRLSTTTISLLCHASTIAVGKRLTILPLPLFLSLHALGCLTAYDRLHHFGRMPRSDAAQREYLRQKGVQVNRELLRYTRKLEVVQSRRSRRNTPLGLRRLPRRRHSLLKNVLASDMVMYARLRPS